MESRKTAALLCTLLVAACGHGGSSGGTGAPPIPAAPDVAGPTAQIHFPTQRSVTDLAKLDVTGTAFDPSGVLLVRVNGVLATTTNRYARWKASVPLVPGENILRVDTIDDLGNLTSSAATAIVKSVGPLITTVRDINSDNMIGEALITDADLDSVVAMDLTDGMRRLVSGHDAGVGPELQNPISIAVFALGSRALVLDAGRLLEVDLVSGDRTLVASDGVGSGPTLEFARGVMLDEANGRALVASGPQEPVGILAVELATGNRDELSTTNTGTGPAFEAPEGLALDAANNRLLVTDRDLRALVAVNLLNGARTMLSSPSIGEGPVMEEPSDPRFDPAGGALYLVDDVLAALISIDLGTGDRTAVSDQTHGSGPTLLDIQGLSLDLPLGRALVALSDRIMAVDLASGDRSVLSENAQGLGPSFDFPTSSFGHLTGNIIVIQEIAPGVVPPGFELKTVDVLTGNRDIAATHDSGTGPEVLEQFAFECDRTLSQAIGLGRVLINGQPELGVYTINLQTSNRELKFVFPNGPVVLPFGDVQFDETNSRAYVSLGAEIWSIDLVQGTGEVLSGPGIGTGPALQDVRRMVLDIPIGKILATDQGLKAVVAIDASNGNREILSDELTGKGPVLQEPLGIDLDRRRQRAIVTDEADGAVFAITLETGNRELVFGGGAGAAQDMFPDDSPRDVVFDVDRNIAYVIYRGVLDALVALELETSERVIVSR